MTTIAIEGLDKIGKTTQATILEKIDKFKYIKLPNEDQYSGKILRQILNKDPLRPHEPVSFQALMFADQMEIAQKNFNEITGDVVFDRWSPSALVYGVLSGVNEKWIRQLFGNIREPDITIVLHGRPFEIESDIYGRASFQEKVNIRYVTLAKEFGWYLIDGNQSIDWIHEEIKLRIEAEQRG